MGNKEEYAEWYMKKYPLKQNPWTIPLIALLVVMGATIFVILSVMNTNESQDIRSQAHDDTEVAREIPNRGIPRPSGIVPPRRPSFEPSGTPKGPIVATGVPREGRLSDDDWGRFRVATPSPFPTPHWLRCNLVFRFMGIPCVDRER